MYICLTETLWTWQIWNTSRCNRSLRLILFIIFLIILCFLLAGCFLYTELVEVCVFTWDLNLRAIRLGFSMFSNGPWLLVLDQKNVNVYIYTYLDYRSCFSEVLYIYIHLYIGTRYFCFKCGSKYLVLSHLIITHVYVIRQRTWLNWFCWKSSSGI